MHSKTWMTMAVMTALGTMGAAIAGGNGLKMQAKPGTFDPNHLNHVDANWVTKQGLPDQGESDHALVMSKDTVTTEFSTPGAEITGAENQTIDVANEDCFGFDVRADSHIGAGAPRFNLVATDGFHFVGGAAYGHVIDTLQDRQKRTWYRVRFNPSDPNETYPPVTPGAKIKSLTLIADEGSDTPVAFAGHYVMDNISFDPIGGGEVRVGKPGQNRAGDNP